MNAVVESKPWSSRDCREGHHRKCVMGDSCVCVCHDAEPTPMRQSDAKVGSEDVYATIAAAVESLDRDIEKLDKRAADLRAQRSELSRERAKMEKVLRMVGRTTAPREQRVYPAEAADVLRAILTEHGPTHARVIYRELLTDEQRNRWSESSVLTFLSGMTLNGVLIRPGGKKGMYAMLTTGDDDARD